MDYLKISDEKVIEKTGRAWKKWFKILDKMKAETIGHAKTAKKLTTDYQLSGWWAQVVTIRYEKERGYWVRHAGSTICRS